MSVSSAPPLERGPAISSPPRLPSSPLPCVRCTPHTSARAPGAPRRAASGNNGFISLSTEGTCDDAHIHTPAEKEDGVPVRVQVPDCVGNKRNRCEARVRAIRDNRLAVKEVDRFRHPAAFEHVPDSSPLHNALRRELDASGSGELRQADGRLGRRIDVRTSAYAHFGHLLLHLFQPLILEPYTDIPR